MTQNPSSEDPPSVVAPKWMDEERAANYRKWMSEAMAKNLKASPKTKRTAPQPGSLKKLFGDDSQPPNSK